MPAPAKSPNDMSTQDPRNMEVIHNHIGNVNEMVPQLRFPDFKGEWEEKRLGDCLDYEQPTDYIVHSIEYDNSYKT